MLRLAIFLPLLFLTTSLAAFEANITNEERRRLTEDVLFIDLSVGEIMNLYRSSICSFDGKFYLPGLLGPAYLEPSYAQKWSYLKVKRMPNFTVTAELMPPKDGSEFKEKDFVFATRCFGDVDVKVTNRFLFPDLLPQGRVPDNYEHLFEVISINGFLDARSLWDSFKEIKND